MTKERLEQIKKAYGQPMKDGNYPDEMIAEIEKCWAITELVVKGLKRISNDMDFSHIMARQAREILSEIERLTDLI